jgi:predicted nucleic acid-binding protein
LHVPVRQTWEMAAKIDLRLRERINLESKLQTRSFANDILIAASARELGAIVVTENLADFSIIASVLDIRFAQLQDAFEIS